MTEQEITEFCKRFQEFLETEATRDVHASSIESGVESLADRVRGMCFASAVILGQWAYIRSEQHDLGCDIIESIQRQIQEGVRITEEARAAGVEPYNVSTSLIIQG